jgi:invasion protein IalB
MRIIIAAVLALSMQAVQAQQPGEKTLSQIELNAWQAYCSSELDGDASVCGCVLEKQFEQNSPEIVKGSLLQMVADDPNATDSDNTNANAALLTQYAGDAAGALEDMQAFKSTLDDNLNACTPKDG